MHIDSLAMPRLLNCRLSILTGLTGDIGYALIMRRAFIEQKSKKCMNQFA